VSRVHPPKSSKTLLPEATHFGDSFFGRIANSEKFQHITLFVIVLNAFWISIDVQWNHSALKDVDGRLPLEPYSLVVENLFLRVLYH